MSYRAGSDRWPDASDSYKRPTIPDRPPKMSQTRAIRVLAAFGHSPREVSKKPAANRGHAGSRRRMIRRNPRLSVRTDKENPVSASAGEIHRRAGPRCLTLLRRCRRRWACPAVVQEGRLQRRKNAEKRQFRCGIGGVFFGPIAVTVRAIAPNPRRGCGNGARSGRIFEVSEK
jgi:hypothetical protein